MKLSRFTSTTPLLRFLPLLAFAAREQNPSESNKLHVVATEKSTVAKDAVTEVGPDSYRIDTAPYRLSPDGRAFGDTHDRQVRRQVMRDRHVPGLLISAKRA